MDEARDLEETHQFRSAIGEIGFLRNELLSGMNERAPKEKTHFPTHIGLTLVRCEGYLRVLHMTKTPEDL